MHGDSGGKEAKMSRQAMMKAVIHFWFFIFAMMVWAPPVMAKAETLQDSKALDAFADDFFLQKMSRHHVPGAALVIVKDGEIIFSKGYGYANIEKKIPVNPQNTIFRVASVSKIFTIAGVMQLEEQGLIDINQDVNNYLRNFKVENNYAEPIRIKYLLTHTDGFETRDLGTFAQEPADLLPLENILKNDLNSPVQAPGSKITYGGYGTALAGYLISQVTDRPFEEYLNDSIFRPLNMENSTFDQVLPENLKENLAVVYNYEESTGQFTPAPFLYVNTAPTGALSTTPEDMGKFLLALLNGGRYGENRILQKRTAEKILTRQYTSNPSLPGVTYGFMESLCNGQRGLIRDGSGVGIRSQIYLLPEHNLGYFYVQNIRGDEMAEEFNEAFMDQFFPGKEEKPDKPIDFDSKELGKYEGIYRPAQTAKHTLVKMEALAMGDLQIKADKKGDLTVTVLGESEIYGGFPKVSQWEEIKPLLFRRADQERYMAFQGNEAGEIISLTSGSGYHGSFVKIPWYESSRIQLYLLIFYMAVFLTVITIHFLQLIKRRRNVLQISGFLSLLFLTGTIGTLYTLFFKRVAGFPAFAFGVSLPAEIMLTLLLLASILSMIFFILLIKSWSANKMTLGQKISYSMVMITFAGMILWLNYWNLLGYKY